MRQVNLMWDVYADENDDHMVYVQNLAEPYPWYMNVYWTNWVLYFRDLQGESALDALRCPSTPSPTTRGTSVQDYRKVIEGANYSYNFDSLKNGNFTLTKPNGSLVTVGRPNRIGRILTPDGKAAFLDYGTDVGINRYYGYSPSAPVPTFNYIPGGFLSPKGAAKYAANGGTISGSPALLNDFQGGRHAGSVNVMYVDGHVQSLPSKDVGTDFYINVNNTNLFDGLFAAWNKP